MNSIFEIVKASAKHPTELNERGYPLRQEGFSVKYMFAATFDSYYDELFHYAVFETREQAENLLARINAASAGRKIWEGPVLNFDYWITGGCVAASSLKGGATKAEFIPAVKF